MLSEVSSAFQSFSPGSDTGSSLRTNATAPRMAAAERGSWNCNQQSGCFPGSLLRKKLRWDKEGFCPVGGSAGSRGAAAWIWRWELQVQLRPNCYNWLRLMPL